MAYTDTKLIVDECPDTLGPEHLAQFREIGCVAFENALSADEITAASAQTELAASQDSVDTTQVPSEQIANAIDSKETDNSDTTGPATT